MSITLTVNGNSSILVANYFPPIELTQDYVCGLISFDSYHTIPNVDKENNLFHIGKMAVEIPIGTYEMDDIVEIITNKYEPLNQGFIDIKANPNTFRTEIMSSREEVNFNKERSIGPLLGFSKRVLEPGIIHYSDNPVDVTRVNTISVECNIINGSYINEANVHTIHQFSLRVSPGYKISEIPFNVIYLPLNTRQVSTLVLKVVDQTGKLINFRGEDISIRLHLKPI